MQPADWVSGSQVWIIDFVAPFGGVWAIISDLRQIYVGHGFALRRQQDGKIRRLVKFNNYDRGFINPRSDFIEQPLPDSYEDGAL
jgi:cytolysin-activating lysine-acyltransferase